MPEEAALATPTSRGGVARCDLLCCAGLTDGSAGTQQGKGIA